MIIGIDDECSKNIDKIVRILLKSMPAKGIAGTRADFCFYKEYINVRTLCLKIYCIPNLANNRLYTTPITIKCLLIVQIK